MLRKAVFTKFRLIFCTGGLMASALAATAAASDDIDVPREVALALVQEYRELRMRCAQETGQARRSCFHQLHATNSDYKAARAQLNLVGSEDPHNIHLVSF